MVKSIGIIGGGTVGRATARSFIEWTEVRVHDTDQKRSTHTLVEALDTDIIFVCLPTPSVEGSKRCDVSVVERFFKDHQLYRKNFVLKSTVPVGTTKRLSQDYSLPNLVHSPEFLTERCSLTDAQLPARNIVGGISHDGLSECESLLVQLYLERFRGIRTLIMTSCESEYVKLMVNAYAAMKVAIFNEMQTFARAKNLNWSRVMEGVLTDGRITANWARVPGPDGKCGFGGACLPKDLASFAQQLEDEGLLPSMAHAALDRNFGDRNR